MEPISICLYSNRGSYEDNASIAGHFDCLQVHIPNSEVPVIQSSNLQEIQHFIDQHADKYLLGYIGYDVGFNMVENKKPKQQPISILPDSWLVALDSSMVEMSNHSPDLAVSSASTSAGIQLKAMVNQDEYREAFSRIQEHIQQGDIYEINYCIPFVAEHVDLDAKQIFAALNRISPMPFSALIDTKDFAIISASPERFIRKEGHQLMIQPMKGTKARIKGNEKKDKEILHQDKKERSENVMIVDLTRNDLSKIARKGTVKVDELYGVYTFPHVLQMISTVSCEIDPKEKFSNILRATYPMGSMTGAPKKRAMQLIDDYECFARGPFSGMLGYIDPAGNFDFSVLIRTVFYDKVTRKLFVAVGSAITSQSNVEKEYEECLIKLQPLLTALNATLLDGKS